VTAKKKFKKYGNERDFIHLDELHTVEVEENILQQSTLPPDLEFFLQRE
jgi:hypothetical protein